MKIAFQMDPMPDKDVEWSTSLALAEEAQKRGFETWHYGPGELSLRGNKLFAQARRFTLDFQANPYYRFAPDQAIELDQMDVLFVRQDPPFDMAYITNLYLLDHLAGKVRMVNMPAAIRNAPEKILITHFPDLTPDTLITSDFEEIAKFFKQHGDIILKPLYMFLRKGIHKAMRGDDLAAIWRDMQREDKLPIIAQPYLHEVSEGDKRIIVLDGEPIAAFDRLLPIDWKVGQLFDRERPAEITAQEREICARLKPMFEAMDLFFVGLDVIGGRVTEINVTSPGGLRELDYHHPGLNSSKIFWDRLLAKMQ